MFIPPNHKVRKVGRFLQALMENAQKAWNLGEHASIDEQVVLCNSRKCSYKQVLKHKKYNGILLYSVNDPVTGYTFAFEADRRNNEEGGRPGFAMRLCEYISGERRRVWIDSVPDHSSPRLRLTWNSTAEGPSNTSWVSPQSSMSSSAPWVTRTPC